MPSVQIVSTSTPALNGTYPLSAAQDVAEVAEYIAVNNKFPDELTALPWLDVNGTPRSFTTTAQFLAFATAMGDMQTALDLGNTPPSQPVTIP